MPNKVSQFIGDVARPVSIIVASVSGSVATVITSLRVEDGTDGALLLGAAWAGVAALYGFKAVEVWKTAPNDKGDGGG